MLISVIPVFKSKSLPENNYLHDIFSKLLDVRYFNDGGRDAILIINKVLGVRYLKNELFMSVKGVHTKKITGCPVFK